MKKISLLILCTCFTFAALHAQKRSREKIKTLKVAYITEKLQLSSDEAQNFWPVYNAHEEKRHEYRYKKFGEIKRRLRGEGIDNISESDAKKMLDQIAALEESVYLQRKKMMKDLQKVISAKKILLLKKAEDDFNRDLLGRLREKRQKKFNNN